MYLQFLPFLQADMTQVVQNISPGKQEVIYPFYIVNIMGAEDLVMQGASASTRAADFHFQPEDLC